MADMPNIEGFAKFADHLSVTVSPSIVVDYGKSRLPLELWDSLAFDQKLQLIRAILARHRANGGSNG